MIEGTTVLEESLTAVIGVWFRDGRTYYVKRSDKMKNYPGLWSLFSLQYRSTELSNPLDLTDVQVLMKRMSKERLRGREIGVKRHLVSGDSDANPMNKHVFLHLYEIRMAKEPDLNLNYYTAGAWLTATQYEQRNAGTQCGLCLRLWSDYAWLSGIHDRPFVPSKGSG